MGSSDDGGLGEPTHGEAVRRFEDARDRWENEVRGESWGTKGEADQARSGFTAGSTYILRDKRGRELAAFRTVANGLVRLRPQPLVRPLTVDADWRQIVVRAVTLADGSAVQHTRFARIYLFAGLATGVLGLIVSTSILLAEQWTTYRIWTSRLDVAASYETFLRSEIQFIDQQATRESLLRFAMSDAQKTADEAIKDPAQLGQFREAVAAVLAGLKGQDHERKQLEALENQFESHASTLQIIFDSEKQFRWSRDLLPIIRISSVLFFIEVFAGFFLALSRREESLALYWKKVRGSQERLLALPGLISALKGVGCGDEVLASISRDMLSSEGQTSVPEEAKNPVTEAVRGTMANIQETRDRLK